jgi:hypothetical protein
VARQAAGEQAVADEVQRVGQVDNVGHKLEQHDSKLEALVRM